MDRAKFTHYVQGFCAKLGSATPTISETILLAMPAYSERFSDDSLRNIAYWSARVGFRDEQMTPESIEEIIRLFKIPEKRPAPITRLLIPNNETIVRRMDSLARLLSLDQKLSPCVSVMLWHGEMIIASNRKPTAEAKVLADFLSNKAAILQEFLTKKLVELQGDDCRLKPETVLQIISVIDQLLANGSADYSICDQNATSPRTSNLFERLLQDLCKVSVYYLKGRKNCSAAAAGVPPRLLDEGFDASELEALTNPRVVLLVGHPDEHAEQLLVHYYDEGVVLKDKARIESAIPLGITKLCCWGCAEFLDQREEFKVRGTHKGAYKLTLVGHASPSVPKRAEKPETKGSLVHEDSDSEVDVYSTRESKLAVARQKAQRIVLEERRLRLTAASDRSIDRDLASVADTHSGVSPKM